MKLTDAEIRAMKRFASSMADHIPPCPWNPFPRNSEWGRKIEAYWRRYQLAALRALASGERTPPA